MALTVGAIFCFSIMDATVKAVSPEIGTLPAIWARYAGQMVLVIIIVSPRLSSVMKSEYLGLQILRSILLMAATFFFFSGIARITLAEASAVMNLNPIFITLGAALFLGEAVGWRRWTATFIGFLGVLMVVRPGLEGFDANALFAVAGVIGLAIRDVATRAIPRSLTSLRLGALAMLLLVPTGLIMASFSGGFQTPSAISLVYISIAAIIGVGGYYAVTSATRLGEISVIAPFRYSRLVFAMLVGIFVFSERPDLWTMLGAAIIILSGIYTFVRERRIRQKLAAAAALQF